MTLLDPTSLLGQIARRTKDNGSLNPMDRVRLIQLGYRYDTTNRTITRNGKVEHDLRLSDDQVFVTPPNTTPGTSPGPSPPSSPKGGPGTGGSGGSDYNLSLSDGLGSWTVGTMASRMQLGIDGKLFDGAGFTYFHLVSGYPVGMADRSFSRTPYGEYSGQWKVPKSTRPDNQQWYLNVFTPINDERHPGGWWIRRYSQTNHFEVDFV